MGNCSDKRLPLPTTSTCDMVFEREWEDMTGEESSGEGRGVVVVAVVVVVLVAEEEEEEVAGPER